MSLAVVTRRLQRAIGMGDVAWHIICSNTQPQLDMGMVCSMTLVMIKTPTALTATTQLIDHTLADILVQTRVFRLC